MPLAGHPEIILPLHAHQDGSISQWTYTIKSYSRNLARRISLSRALVGFLSILALYILLGSHSSNDPNTINNNRDSLSGRNEANGKSNNGIHLSLKDKKLKEEQERRMLEWDERSSYRTDLSEVGPGRTSSFPVSLFTSSDHPASSSPTTSKYVPVTAVVLSWKRKEGVKSVVAHLRKYPFIQEILIWNNNADVVLSKHDFADKSRPNSENSWPSVTIFNSVANLHDFSKYTTCSLAKYDHCYIQDDDWINLTLDSMYSLYIEQPDTLVTSTLPAMHAQQRSWVFQNPQIGLHTGFTWIGAGSFMSKKSVFKFLMQLGGSNLWKERIKLSDFFFSIWRNQYPTVLSNSLAPLDQSSSWSGPLEPWTVVYDHLTDAIGRITTVLSGQGSVFGSGHRANAKADFTAEEEKPVMKDRISRSSCGNDKCLFQTNVDMFPAPEQVKWPADSHNRDVLVHEARIKAMNFPTPEFVAMHTYHYAVDQDVTTCWRSFHSVANKDFFGLRFILPLLDLGENAKSIEIWSTLASTLQALQSNMVIKASIDGNTWMTCSGTVERGQDSIRFLDLNCADTGKNFGQQDTRGIQYIRFEMTDKPASPIEICGIRIGDMIL